MEMLEKAFEWGQGDRLAWHLKTLTNLRFYNWGKGFFPDITHASAWTAKTFQSLKPDRKIGQMLLTQLHRSSETSFLQALKSHLNLTRTKETGAQSHIYRLPDELRPYSRQCPEAAPGPAQGRTGCKELGICVCLTSFIVHVQLSETWTDFSKWIWLK